MNVKSRISLLGQRGGKFGRVNPTSPRSTVWSHAETENLLKGVKMFGVGKWSIILNHFEFASHRTKVSLKDKWRNLQGRKQNM